MKQGSGQSPADGANGLIHIYCGEGKGKTTAAVGLCVRAVGAGKRVALVQFLKSGETGELAPLANLGVRVLRGKSGGFSFSMTEEQKIETRRVHDGNLREAVGWARAGELDLLVLDEALGALRRGLLDEKLLRELVEEKQSGRLRDSESEPQGVEFIPAGLELVLTGRNPPKWLVEQADYVSEFQKVKHPYDKGIPARVGIEK